MLFPHVCAQPEIFQGRGGFFEPAYFDKHFVKNTQKKGPAGKNFRVVSPRYCENYISNEKFNPNMNTIRTCFPKLGHFFRFSKIGRRGIMFITEFSYALFTKTLFLFCISLLRSFIYKEVIHLRFSNPCHA